MASLLTKYYGNLFGDINISDFEDLQVEFINRTFEEDKISVWSNDKSINGSVLSGGDNKSNDNLTQATDIYAPIALYNNIYFYSSHSLVGKIFGNWYHIVVRIILNEGLVFNGKKIEIVGELIKKFEHMEGARIDVIGSNSNYYFKNADKILYSNKLDDG